MTAPVLPWLARPGARSWTCGSSGPVRDGEVRAYHASLPGYAPTPLAEVPALAAELGVGRVFVKDESARLGLPAFKVLGASWAVRQVLAGPGPDGAAPATPPPGLAGLRALAARWPGLVLVTATDGNHGRAVARMARLCGAPARVFVPAVTGPATRAAIAGEGAEVVEVAGSYDEAVAAARQWAEDRSAAALVQDTAWPGYEQVPGWIVEGYSTLFGELDAQLAAAGAGATALVAVPVGVGSLAQAAVAHYRDPGSAGRGGRRPGDGLSADRTPRPGNPRPPLRRCWRWSRIPPPACSPASAPAHRCRYPRRAPSWRGSTAALSPRSPGRSWRAGWMPPWR